MQYKKPENLKEMLELQNVLDNSIKNIRPRLLEDIRLSMIAEIIEFNEETKYSHKTWKSKLYNKEKELEELVDIWFFMAQFINAFENKVDEINSYNWNSEIIKLDGQDISLIDTTLTDLTRAISTVVCPVKIIVHYLMAVTKNYGYTKQDILKGYWKKWQKNMERIGKEWN